MATNNNINFGPAALPGTVPTPVLGNNIDRAPAPVVPGAGTGYVPAVTQPVIAATKQPVINPPTVVARTAVVVPVAEQPVAEVVAESTTGPNITASNQQRYITILANGAVITSDASSLDFEGSGFTITSSGVNGAIISINAVAGGYGNSNVTALLAAFGSNTLSTTGNVTGGYILGNGSQLTGIAATYGNANVVANLAALGSNPVSTTGNVTGGNLTTAGIANIASLAVTGSATVQGSISISSSSTSLSATGNVIGGNVTTVGIVSATGNITGGNLSAVNLVINSISSDDSSFVNIEDGVNISSGAISSQENLSLTANAYTWTFRNDGVGLVLPYSATIRDTNNGALAIGFQAGFLPQGTGALAIGYNAALYSQGANSVALGFQSGGYVSSQGNNAVAVGAYAGHGGQGNAAVAVGRNAGNASQGINAVAVGYTAGYDTQGADAVAMGFGAGYQGQGIQAVAIGPSAGAVNQGVYAIAIGAAAGAAGNSAVAVGSSAGYSNQGNFAVAIGKSAGATNQGNNSIILNATGAALDQTTANTFTVAPVRNDVANIGNVMFYNATSKEITYGNVISVAGNITGGNLAIGTITATGNISGGNVLGGANVNATTHTGTTVSVTANVTGGNLLTGGLISATGNITGGNVLFGSGIVSGTGNITGGNVLTGGLISATGNITGGNLAIVGNTATITTANYSVGYLNIPQISLAANVTTALTDAGKHYYSVSASNLALTIANNTSVVWPVGTALSVINRGTANVTVAPGSGVSLYLAGNSTSANRTVTTYGMATVINVAANIWMINGTVV